jgi:hypothetical protein
MSLNKVYEIGFKHALENIKRNGGKIDGDKIIIPAQEPKTVKFEQGFTNMKPLQKTDLSHNINESELSFDFSGTGFVLKGEAGKKNGDSPDYAFDVEVTIDGQKAETAKLPTNFTTRRQEICWKYQLPNKKHSVKVKVLNPNKDYELNSSEYLVYGDMMSTTKK